MSLPLKNLTILVVDDDADDCDLLRSVLEESGASVIVAQSVEDALKLLRQSPPHVVVADIPSDGYALIKVIRECNLEYRGFTAAIAITGFGSAADEKRAITAGFNAYLPKPIEQVDLVRTITRVLRDSTVLAA